VTDSTKNSVLFLRQQSRQRVNRGGFAFVPPSVTFSCGQANLQVGDGISAKVMLWLAKNSAGNLSRRFEPDAAVDRSEMTTYLRYLSTSS
jgi:hypothetical protein